MFNKADIQRRLAWVEKDKIDIVRLENEIKGLKAVLRIAEEQNTRQDIAIQHLITETGVLTQKIREMKNEQLIKH